VLATADYRQVRFNSSLYQLGHGPNGVVVGLAEVKSATRHKAKLLAFAVRDVRF
jgi:hypothetical protein